jgi:TetR/AcrR family tetracycline transcriptional repressor
MNAQRLKIDPASRERLSPERILDGALALIDRDGLEGLSMRKLAAELDVSAMSLYNHISGKEALLEGVIGRLLGEIDLTAVAAEDDWAEALKVGFRSFRRALLAHPNAVAVIESKQVISPESMRPVEVSLATLRGAGFSAEDAMKAHWVLVGFTLGHVSFQCTNPLQDAAAREAHTGAHETLPAESFPCLHEALPYMSGCDFEDAYEFGLDAIISGLTRHLATGIPPGP